MSRSLQLLQINLHHCISASSALIHQCTIKPIDIVLIQEPWVNKGIKGLHSKQYSLIANHHEPSPRAAILIKKNLFFTPVSSFISRDLAAVSLRTVQNGKVAQIVIASAYFPGDSTCDPPPQAVRELINFCNQQGIPYLMGCDSNTHHSAWGSSNINRRGEALFDFLLKEDAVVINEGKEPTFINHERKEVLDITFTNGYYANNLSNWYVSEEESLSDHRYIFFKLNKVTTQKSLHKNPRKTDWPLFNDFIATNIKDCQCKFSNCSELEEGAIQLQQLMTQAFNLATRETRPKSPGEPDWWTEDIKTMKKEVRRLWNRGKKTHDLSAHRSLKTKLSNAICQAKRESWKKLCESLTNITTTTGLFRALRGEKNNGLGLLMKEDKSFTSSPMETIELLLKTHFPGSIKALEHQTPESVGLRTARNSRLLAEQIVTVSRVEYAVHSFKPFKSPGGDRILPKMIQSCLPSIQATMIELFRSSLELGYIPSPWRQVNVVFIPKPGKDPSLPKSYRPISLSSFFLKTIERLVHIYIQSKCEINKPLHHLQFAYQKGKSTELAVHHLIERAETAISQGHIAIAAFLDIQGAFDNTNFHSISDALAGRGVERTVRRWTINMLQDRVISATLGSDTATIQATKGCPQGGVLSPLLWSLVIDGLLQETNGVDLYTIGYADDIAVVVTGKFESTIAEVLYNALRRIERWCNSHGLSINPLKTTLLPMHRRINPILPQLSLHGCTIPYSEEAIYLGIKIDTKLSFKPHCQWILSRAKKLLWSTHSMAGKKWGTSPKMMLQLYTSAIRPVVTYGSFMWWPITRTQTAIAQCNSFQRAACLLISGCTRSCPTAAIERAIGLLPLHLQIVSTAMNTTFRLARLGLLQGARANHTSLLHEIQHEEALEQPSDLIKPFTNFDNNFTIKIPERQTYLNPHFLPTDNPDDWYTDGSKTEAGCGSGVYNSLIQISIPLKDTASVFQAELHAISVCADQIAADGTEGRVIRIFSDSQAAIQAISNPLCKSQTVKDCITRLNTIGQKNNLTVLWIPGHSNLHGNEEADRLANMGSATTDVQLMTTLPIGTFIHKQWTESWIQNKWDSYWNNLKGLKTSKALISKESTKNLIYLKRSSLRLIIGYLSGHSLNRNYLFKIGAAETPICRICGHEAETTAHLLQVCPLLDGIRYRSLGITNPTHTQIKNAHYKPLLRFIKVIESTLSQL